MIKPSEETLEIFITVQNPLLDATFSQEFNILERDKKPQIIHGFHNIPGDQR